MDKRKKKNSSSKRKRRIQLDDDEEDESYTRSYTRSRPPDPSTTGANNSTRLSLTARTSTGPRKSTSLTRSSTSVSSTLPTSTGPSRSSITDILQERLNAESSSAPSGSNNTNQNSESGAANSTPPRPKSASSPDPNCAICLGPLENKSFTDSCFHQFCFVCLVEWSKVKAECPLCKQSFKSIVHNVRSYNDYDQYHIPRPEDRNILQELSGPGSVRFRYRTTVTDHRYTTLADRINREIESRLLQRPSRSLPIPNYRRLRQPANSDFRRSVYLQRLKRDSPPSNTRRRVRETSPSFFRDNPAQTHRLVPWVNRELNALLQGHGEQVAFVLDLIMGLIKRYAIDSEEFYQHVFPYVGRHTRKFMQEFLMFAKSPYHMAAYDRHSTYVQSDEPHHDSDSDSNHRAGIDSIRNDGNDSDVIVVSPGNTPVPGSTNSQPPPPRREESSLDNWESRVLTAGDPYFPGFAPIRRTYRTEDLSSMNPYSGLRTDYAPTSASGWDSPTPGPSQLRLTLQDLDFPMLTSGLSTHLSASSSIGGSIWTPSSRSYSAPSSQPLPSTSSIFGSLFDSINLMPRQTPPTSQVETSVILGAATAQNPAAVPENSDLDNSDVEIIEVEKPWNERSPIRLSSGGETDYDVMITGTTHINDPIKVEKKKKKHKKQQDERSSDPDKERRKRGREGSGERHSKKKRHVSRSPRIRILSRSRSRSLSPVRLTLIRSPDYQHKKFAYKTHNERQDEVSPYNSPRYVSNRISRSRSLSISGSDTESHFSITSRRRSSKSKHSSIKIFEYRKKSSKSKKSKKQKKNKGSDNFEVSDAEPHDVPKKTKKHKKKRDSDDFIISDDDPLDVPKKNKKHKKRKDSDDFVISDDEPFDWFQKNKKHKKSRDSDDFVISDDEPLDVPKKKKKHKKRKDSDDFVISDDEPFDWFQKNKKHKKSRDSDDFVISDDEPFDWSKKNKKHLKNTGSSDDFVISEDDLDIATQPHKGITHQSTGNEKRKKKQTSCGSNKKSKHKSKKKRLHKEKKQKEDQSKGDRNGSSIIKSNKLCIYTSDSDPDSISDGVEIDSGKESFDPVKTSSAFRPSGVEFVEVDAAQAAVIDQELDNINKTLANNDYISSLLTDSIIDSQDLSLPNTDPNRMVNPNEIFNQRSFKKHPYGHKKSGKYQNSAIIQGGESNTSSEGTFSTVLRNGASKPEDSIQSHDITSCSDIDYDRQLPSFLTFSNLNSNYLNTFQNSSTLFNSPESRKRYPNETPAYESPTSTGLFSCRDGADKDNETVDVDGLSEDSDIDITGVTVPSEPVSVISYKTSNDSIKIGTSKDYIDVVGDSNGEQSDEEANKDINKSHEDSNILQESNSTYISDIDVENDDSDIECSLVEGHKTFEIDGDTDSDKEKADDVSDIDITGCSDDEVMIDADHEKDENTKIIKINDVHTLNLDTSSETDLDYNCEDINSAISSPDCNSEGETDKYEESEENVEANTNPVTIFESDNERVVDEHESIGVMKQSTDNKSITTCEETAGPSADEDTNMNAHKNVHDCPINEEIVDKTLDIATSVQPLAGTSSLGNDVTDIPDEGEFGSTANPLYRARPLSVSEIVDATRVFSSRDRSTPEQEYIINIPRECESPDSLTSVSSPELQASPDLRDRHFDDDFMPED